MFITGTSLRPSNSYCLKLGSEIKESRKPKRLKIERNSTISVLALGRLNDEKKRKKASIVLMFINTY